MAVDEFFSCTKASWQIQACMNQTSTSNEDLPQMRNTKYERITGKTSNRVTPYGGPIANHQVLQPEYLKEVYSSGELFFSTSFTPTNCVVVFWLSLEIAYFCEFPRLRTLLDGVFCWSLYWHTEHVLIGLLPEMKNYVPIRYTWCKTSRSEASVNADADWQTLRERLLARWFGFF